MFTFPDVCWKHTEYQSHHFIYRNIACHHHWNLNCSVLEHWGPYLLSCSCPCHRAGQGTASQSWERGGLCRGEWSCGRAGQTPLSLWSCCCGGPGDPVGHSAEVAALACLQTTQPRPAAAMKLLRYVCCYLTVNDNLCLKVTFFHNDVR